MSKSVDLFSVRMRVSLSRPPVELICQAMDLNGEKVLWVDGMTMDTPILLPIASVNGCIEYRGTFRDFLTLHMGEAGLILSSSAGQHSPTIIARAVRCMTYDKKLTAEDALHLVIEEALDILDADSGDAEVFFRNSPEAQAAIASRY
jgi:hypothetical protein